MRRRLPLALLVLACALLSSPLLALGNCPAGEWAPGEGICVLCLPGWEPVATGNTTGAPNNYPCYTCKRVAGGGAGGNGGGDGEVDKEGPKCEGGGGDGGIVILPFDGELERLGALESQQLSIPNADAESTATADEAETRAR